MRIADGETTEDTNVCPVERKDPIGHCIIPSEAKTDAGRVAPEVGGQPAGKQSEEEIMITVSMCATIVEGEPVSKERLEQIISDHKEWLEDHSKGSRACFLRPKDVVYTFLHTETDTGTVTTTYTR